jgi:hypothetical protein
MPARLVEIWRQNHRGETIMIRFNFVAALLGLIIGVLAAPPASGWERGDVDVLAVLPDVTPGMPSSVEGLRVGPDGNIYVPSFGLNSKGALTGNAALFVISPKGDILRKVKIANSSPHMLGLAFNPVTGALWVLDFGAARFFRSIQRPAHPCYWRALSPTPASTP